MDKLLFLVIQTNYNVFTVGARKYHGNEAANYKPATMDELPIPQGSWKAQYDAKQKTYNMQLAFGLIYAIGTIYFVSNEKNDDYNKVLVFFLYFDFYSQAAQNICPSLTVLYLQVTQSGVIFFNSAPPVRPSEQKWRMSIWFEKCIN